MKATAVAGLADARLSRPSQSMRAGSFCRLGAKKTGDGFFAAFDGPARGIRCAQAILSALERIGIQARSGLHTGEAEVVGDNLAGIAVHTGARVAALAGPGEVLVSSTVRDLVAGSGIEFEDRGLHELKGLDEPRRLFAVRSPSRVS